MISDRDGFGKRATSEARRDRGGAAGGSLDRSIASSTAPARINLSVVDCDRNAMLRKIIINVLLAAGLVVGTWFAANAVKAMAPKAQRVVPDTLKLTVQTIEIRARDFQPTVTAYGRVRAWRRSVVSSNLPGTIEWIHPRLHEGELLDSGEVVLRLDASRIPARLAQIDASMQRIAAESLTLVVERQNTESLLVLARHNLDLAVADLRRSDELLAVGKLSVGAHDAKRLQEQQYRSSLVAHQNLLRGFEPHMQEIRALLRGNRAELSLLQREIEDYTIQMPFAGYIGEKRVGKKEQVQTGSPLFAVSDLEQVEVLLEVPIRERPGVLVGAEVLLSSPAFEGWQGHGRVARLAATVDPRAGTVTAYVLAAGMQTIPLTENLFLRGDILGTLQEDQVCLPRHVVQDNRVYVVQNGLAVERTITILHRSESEYVVRGLNPGERVVSSHLEALYVGCPVELADD